MSLMQRFTDLPYLPTPCQLQATGSLIAMLGVALPMLMIGLLKFTAIEVEALIPLISNTPWLAWLHLLFGEAGASYFLGIVEILAAILVLASRWSSKAAIAGGALCSLTFIITLSTMLSVPIWDAQSGGFPWLNHYGSFLIKDTALLGISLMILAQGLAPAGTAASR
ncbi:DUF417 family protein [Pseudomonas sp. TWI628]|uniref:DUF417 family protein n=1 Tax=Pseudomonas sp. TWI628 TaxID=3136788 RepID=UPI003209F8CA